MDRWLDRWVNRWQVYNAGDEDGTLDVTPIYDVHQHEASDDCWCKPQREDNTRIHNIGEERLPEEDRSVVN